MEAPDGCPQEIYTIMMSAWEIDPKQRPTFKSVLEKLNNLRATTVQYFDGFYIFISVECNLNTTKIVSHCGEKERYKWIIYGLNTPCYNVEMFEKQNFSQFYYFGDFFNVALQV